ncbi:MAG: tetratricopeptide repeat protein [Arcobacteraceae bacterium]
MKSKNILFIFVFIVLIVQTALFADSYSLRGDKAFHQQNYKEAIDNYEKSQDIAQSKVKVKLIKSYIELGNNYSSIQKLRSALAWYQKATLLDKNVASMEISLVYEKLGARYESVHNYTKALQFYEKALSIRDSSLQTKIQQMKRRVEHTKNLSNDTRKIVTKSSPIWTQAVGRLIIPTELKFISEKKYQKQQKNCSASLVNLSNNSDSSVIITAAHCITEFNGSVGALKFIIKDINGDIIHRVAKIEFASKFDIKKITTTTDFAILSLDKPISKTKVTPLIIQKDSFATLQKKSYKNYASLVGFSSDIAKYGAKLTYDPKCLISSFNTMYGASTCSGFNGASGGPIILTTTKNNIDFASYFVGVVSHFRNKEYTNMFFAPHHQFFDTIVAIINKKS